MTKPGGPGYFQQGFSPQQFPPTRSFLPHRVMNTSIHHVHLVSDATGETISHVTRATLVQFESGPVQQHVWNLIRTERQLDMVITGITQFPGLVLYTFVDEELRKKLEQYCKTNGIRA